MTTTMRISQRLARTNVASMVIASLGALFLGFYLLFLTLNEAYLQGPVWLFSLGLILMLILSIGLVYGGYWLANSEFSAEQSWRVTIWVFAGLVGAVALTFWPIFYQRIVGVPIADPIFILLVSAGLGANAGVIAGVAQIQSERQFERIQRARDSFEYLNRLLRHNVLNAVNIISGNANLLLEEVQSDSAVTRANTIQQQSDQITDLIQSVKVLVRQNTEYSSSMTVDLSSIVADELEKARESYNGVVIESELTDGVYVQADPLVSAVVENLVTNAIIHHDKQRPQVNVFLDTRAGSAVLRVADNGPGLAEEDKVSMVEPDPYGDHGIGLYLVNTLVARYDGEIQFDDNEPRGTVVTVELPVSAESDGERLATATTS